jgi:hypothetical protein
MKLVLKGGVKTVLGIKKKRGKMRRDLGNKNDLEEKMKQLQDTI